jgi:hypothetical protein
MRRSRLESLPHEAYPADISFGTPGPDLNVFGLCVGSSHAIKCPCVEHHLVGCKKVQQQLAQPGATEEAESLAMPLHAVTCRYIPVEEAGSLAIRAVPYSTTGRPSRWLIDRLIA